MAKYKVAKSRNEDLLLDEDTGSISWAEFYGIEPNTEPWLSRNNFGLIHTVPVPNESMWVEPWYEQSLLLDVIEKTEDNNEKVVNFQKRVTVVYDEFYIGHYCQVVLRDLGVLPNITLELAESFGEDLDINAIDKKLSDKLIKQRWERLRGLTLTGKVTEVLSDSLEVDMGEIDTLIKALGATGSKAEGIRNKAKSDPKAFTKYKEMILQSLSDLIE